MYKYFFLICISVLFSIKSYGETYTYVNGLIVKEIYAGYEEGHIFFGVNKDVANPNGCSSGAQRTIGVDPSRGNVDHVLSVLLYAHAANKNVDIQVYDSSCIANHIVIRRVKVSN